MTTDLVTSHSCEMAMKNLSGFIPGNSMSAIRNLWLLFNCDSTTLQQPALHSTSTAACQATVIRQHLKSVSWQRVIWTPFVQQRRYKRIKMSLQLTWPAYCPSVRCSLRAWLSSTPVKWNVNNQPWNPVFPWINAVRPTDEHTRTTCAPHPRICWDVSLPLTSH